MKVCTVCLVEKNENEFNKKAMGKNGLSSFCKECRAKKYVEKEKDKKPHLEYYKKNKDKVMERMNKNKDKLFEYQRVYKKINKDRIRARDIAYIARDPVAYHKKRYQRQKIRYNNDPKFRLKHKIRNLIKSAFDRLSTRGKTKTNKQYGIDYNKIFDKIGQCPGTGKECHLDHIIPLACFNLDIDDHIRLANLPCNLRWISAKDNLVKQNKIPDFAYNDPELLEILKTIGLVTS